MTQVVLGAAGTCNARRSHVRSSTKLAPSRRVSTKIGSASVLYTVLSRNLDADPGQDAKQQLTIVAVHDGLWTMQYAPPAELPVETKVSPIT